MAIITDPSGETLLTVDATSTALRATPYGNSAEYEINRTPVVSVCSPAWYGTLNVQLASPAAAWGALVNPKESTRALMVRRVTLSMGVVNAAGIAGSPSLHLQRATLGVTPTTAPSGSTFLRGGKKRVFGNDSMPQVGVNALGFTMAGLATSNGGWTPPSDWLYDPNPLVDWGTPGNVTPLRKVTGGQLDLHFKVDPAGSIESHSGIEVLPGTLLVWRLNTVESGTSRYALSGAFEWDEYVITDRYPHIVTGA